MILEEHVYFHLENELTPIELKTLSKSHVFTFGLHKGETILDVWKSNHSYIIWCIENIDTFHLSIGIIREIRVNFIEELCVKKLKRIVKYVNEMSIMSSMESDACSKNIIKIATKKGWVFALRNFDFSETLIEKSKKFLDWDTVCQNQILSEEFILKYQDVIDLKKVAHFDKISTEFLEANLYRFGWVNLSRSKLPIEFIRKHKYFLDWIKLTQNNKFSEENLEEFKDFIYWIDIHKTQDISEDFIWKFRYYITAPIAELPITEKFKRKLIEEYKNPKNFGKRRIIKKELNEKWQEQKEIAKTIRSKVH